MYDSHLHKHDILSTSFHSHHQSKFHALSTTSYHPHYKYAQWDCKENFPTARKCFLNVLKQPYGWLPGQQCPLVQKSCNSNRYDNSTLAIRGTYILLPSF